MRNIIYYGWFDEISVLVSVAHYKIGAVQCRLWPRERRRKRTYLAVRGKFRWWRRTEERTKRRERAFGSSGQFAKCGGQSAKSGQHTTWFSANGTLPCSFALQLYYRVIHLLRDLGLVDLDWNVPMFPSCPAASTFLISAYADFLANSMEYSKWKSTKPSPRLVDSPCTLNGTSLI